MNPISRYVVDRKDLANESLTLARDGRRLPITFRGFAMEAQFGLADGHTLVCLADDSPYDAMLHWYLLDADDALVDALEGGGVFTPGTFKAIKVAELTVDFEFFTNDCVYRLGVSPASHFRFSLPNGWRYKHRLRPHRLTLETITTGAA